MRNILTVETRIYVDFRRFNPAFLHAPPSLLVIGDVCGRCACCKTASVLPGNVGNRITLANLRPARLPRNDSPSLRAIRHVGK